MIVPSFNLFLQDLIMDWIKKYYFSITVQIAFYHPAGQFSLVMEGCFYAVINQGKVRETYSKRESLVHEDEETQVLSFSGRQSDGAWLVWGSRSFAKSRCLQLFDQVLGT